MKKTMKLSKNKKYYNIQKKFMKGIIKKTTPKVNEVDLNDKTKKLQKGTPIEFKKLVTSMNNKKKKEVKHTTVTKDEVSWSIKNDDEFLAHYGVLGMRWGVRRDRRTLARASKVKEKKATKLIQKKNKKLTKKVKSSKLTDAQLREKINRLQMEQQYKKLTESKISKGTKAAGKLLGDIGKEVVKENIKSELSPAAKRLKKKLKKRK